MGYRPDSAPSLPGRIGGLPQEVVTDRLGDFPRGRSFDPEAGVDNDCAGVGLGYDRPQLSSARHFETLRLARLNPFPRIG
jgi:hypothetical protein